jgi:hypothetical protein
MSRLYSSLQVGNLHIDITASATYVSGYRCSLDSAIMENGGTRYEGQDTRPTSRRELYGWYSYGLAAEVFTVCGVGELMNLSSNQ